MIGSFMADILLILEIIVSRWCPADGFAVPVGIFVLISAT